MPTSQTSAPVSNEMPSASASPNRQPPTAPASDGGGVLPYGNNKSFPAQGKSNSTTGTPFFAEGGPVGGDPARAAFAYGRRKMGLPVDFENGGGGEPSFDDGGVVPDPSAAPSPQGQAVDPHSALKYLAGDGALSPDVVLTMEAMADPDGSMDDTDRLDAVLGKAPSPDVAFGVLQHHRTKYNSYTAAARVAAEKGDFAKAAAYANKAHASVPGSRRRFSPTAGGLHMTSGSQGGEQAFGQGGSVDSSNPENMDTQDTDQSFEDGGIANEVGDDDPRYENMPESLNVEDRRFSRGEGWSPKASWRDAPERNGPDPDKVGRAQKDNFNQGQEDQASAGAFDKGSGVVRKQRAFADGGFVDEEDPGASDGSEDAGVDEGEATSPVADDDLTTGAVQPPAPQPAYDPGKMMSPEDFDRLMHLGYDKASEIARPAQQSQDPRYNTISPSEITDKVYGGLKTLGKGAMALGRAAIDPRNWPTAPMGPGWSAPGFEEPNQATGVKEINRTMPEAEEGMNQGETQQNDGTAAPTSPAAPAQPDEDAGYKKGQQHTRERRDEMLSWLEQQANKMWPGNWSHDAARKNAYIQRGMDQFFQHDVSRENEIMRDRAGTADRAQRAKSSDNQYNNEQKMEREKLALNTRRVIEAAKQTGAYDKFVKSEFFKNMRSLNANNPEAFSDPAVAKQVNDQMAAHGMRVQQGQEQEAVNMLLNNKPIQAPGANAGAPHNAPLGGLWVDPNGVLRRKSEKGWERAQ